MLKLVAFFTVSNFGSICLVQRNASSRSIKICKDKILQCSPALMVVFHPHAHEAPLKLEGAWRRVLDSTEDDVSAGAMTTPLVYPQSSPPSQLPSVLSGTVTLPARSVWVLQAL